MSAAENSPHPTLSPGERVPAEEHGLAKPARTAIWRKRHLCPLCGRRTKDDESAKLLDGRWNHLHCLIAKGVLVPRGGFLVMAKTDLGSERTKQADL
jgi:hypothetical protein